MCFADDDDVEIPDIFDAVLVGMLRCAANHVDAGSKHNLKLLGTTNKLTMR